MLVGIRIWDGPNENRWPRGMQVLKHAAAQNFNIF